MIEILGAIAASVSATSAVLSLRAGHVPGPSAFAHPDAQALGEAGWTWSLVRWEGVRGLCALACAALGSAAGLPAGVLLPFGLLLPSVIVRDRSRAARERSRRAAVRLIAGAHAALRSGANVPEALRRGIAATDDRIARRPLEKALDAFALGASLDEALRAAAAEERDERSRVTLETLALGIGEHLPVSRAAALVGSLVDRLASDERLDAEVRARASGARMQVRVLAAVVPCLAAYLAATTPGVGSTLASPLGQLVLIPSALLLEGCGILLSRRVLSGALR